MRGRRRGRDGKHERAEAWDGVRGRRRRRDEGDERDERDEAWGGVRGRDEREEAWKGWGCDVFAEAFLQQALRYEVSLSASYVRSHLRPMRSLARSPIPSRLCPLSAPSAMRPTWLTPCRWRKRALRALRASLL